MEKQFAAMVFPAAAALKEKLDRLVPEIQRIICICDTKTGGVMQPAVDEIVKMCLDAGLATKRRMMPRNTGIHPENRGKTEVDPINAHDLTLKITGQGYSETKLENPMGFEPQLKGPMHDEQEEFNDRNFALSYGLLHSIPFRDVEYLPVTCSHTSATANIVDGGGPGLHSEIINDEGNIDKNKIMELCPSWRVPLTQGIPCTVFKRELDAACPELAAFLSKAGNQTHGVHTQERKCNSC